MSDMKRQRSQCSRCKRWFSTSHGRGLHWRHVSNAVGRAAKNRLCPDNRSDEQAREEDMRSARNRVRMRDPEMAARVFASLGMDLPGERA